MPKAAKRTARESAPERKEYAWALLLESRHARPPEKEPTRTSERGRPRLNVATYPTSVTFSKGDREALDFWQAQLSAVLGRKVSLGEAAGFVARVCQERLALVQEGGAGLSSLTELVAALVSGAKER